ncbi:MAG TPA: HAMP domain-containing sensor histidine kinase [Candidatus Dormibacteraeota bacterium]|nr:HAMP domain-containing sensor histidine kinase [Candidatus Dormibacteraeota bacterium]
MRPDSFSWPTRRLAPIDLAWAVFAIANLVAIFLVPDWETVPFHFIWVSLTILYGFRVWRLRTTAWVVGVIIVTTGTGLIVDIARGAQPLDELTEVPLMSAMFFAMVWHARRRLIATREMRTVSEENLLLLERERRFIQNASHALRTPITIAIGHAELLRAAADPATIAHDAGVVINELTTLRRLAERLLLLAGAEAPDFLHRRPIEVEPILVEALSRWSPTPRHWRLGVTDEAVVEADAERLAMAIDALVENAVKHTTPDDWIELSVRRNHGVDICVADSGVGIATADLPRIFERFERGDVSRRRDGHGMGLGLAIVKTIAQAHGGTVRVHSEPGRGSQFEIVLAEARPLETYGLAEAEAEAEGDSEAEADGEAEVAGAGVTEGVAPTVGGASKPNQ